MTMKIEVTIPEDEVRSGAAAQYLKRAMSAIGFSAAYEAAARDAVVYGHGTGAVAVTTESAQAVNLRTPEEAAPIGDDSPLRRHAVAEEPKRERGKPSPGKARRTKEEIAEDEAADKAEAAAFAPEARRLAEEGAKQFEADRALISTGEERIDPANPADAAQDAADEAAEAEATKPAELTHDSVRDALQKYLKVYGPPATMEDGPKVFKMLFGDATQKVSDIPSDQASLAKAVAGVEEMTAKNPFKREVNL